MLRQTYIRSLSLAGRCKRNLVRRRVKAGDLAQANARQANGIGAAAAVVAKALQQARTTSRRFTLDGSCHPPMGKTRQASGN